ncbi:hypothetical protein FJ987_11355 [Mesorhizobium sp. CU2]|uniref:hypothetical protein n=1 Tax=unclassified Mesorhizobium TaxID=325217 RepID=UPI00112B7FF3|nr:MULTISPECIES: hypothetical protein [unclassified Mesorhizobium]TPN79423.1 hypothetical protein FJ988_23840 [Mesorhizobium sp. CU3]TPO15939.1 hypothetical protein FJ987_11355 [Mesorhizobium sp. CU2]
MDGAQQFFFTVICIGLGLIAIGLLIVGRSIYRRVEAGSAAVIVATLFGLALSAAGLVILYYAALVLSIK